jgi:uncharacterized protein (TIGR02001 family)
MKKTILALAALAVSVSAYAQDTAKTSELAVTLDTTYVSTYVFRGVRLSDDAIQPSVEASYGNFYAGLWYSDDVNAIASSETDVYAGYNIAINETFSADVGLTRYLYDGESVGDTTEAYVGLSADVLLSPSVYYYHDFDLEVNSYIASIGHSVPVEQVGVTLDLSATFGYVQIPSNDYSYWGVAVAVPYALSETATLTGGLSYTHNDDKSTSQDQVVASLGLSVGF